MKKVSDITKLKAWKSLQRMGFKKIKFTFQGLAYGYGAESKHMLIKPTFRKSEFKDQWFVSKGVKSKWCQSRNILETVIQLDQ
jgi:hypothetical protein